nr:regulatory protein RecX [uncultured Shewanella sp.]
MAVALLARRDHSQLEVRTKLAQKDFPSDEIEICIQFCLEKGYLNDERYALLVVKSQVSKGHGINRIQQVLTQKGITKTICQQVLFDTEYDWFAIAKRKAFKKYHGRPAADYKEKAKRIRYLLAQGFRYDEVQYALSESE